MLRPRHYMGASAANGVILVVTKKGRKSFGFLFRIYW